MYKIGDPSNINKIAKTDVDNVSFLGDVNINPTKINIDPTEIKIDPTEIKIDPTTININPAKINIDTVGVKPQNIDGGIKPPDIGGGINTPELNKLDVPKPPENKPDDLDTIANAEIKNFEKNPKLGDNIMDDAEGIKAGFKNGNDASSAASKLDNLLDSNPTFANKIWGVVKRNPLKVGGAVLLTALGAYGLSMAIKKFKENENKVVGIIKSYKSENNIAIEFTPDATILNNDKVLINDANFIETLNDQTFDVIKIISNGKIEISTTTNVTKYADSGKLTIKTTLENHILNQAEKGKEIVEDGIEKVANTAQNTAFGIFSTIYDIIKPYLVYICGFILIIILIWIGIKFMIK